ADIHYRLIVERFSVAEPFCVPHSSDKAYLDADKVTEQLSLRKWQSGDCFVPYGMKHFKRIRDYLRDRKFTRFEKETQQVVTAGDTIVWLVGERTDDRFRVTGQTRNILVLSVEKSS
ncbi:MAG: tRNA lysidine(34) synthetase TilS, partial [Bacteroides sp.]|nr:tRNA lysidine(34) synthetase TilS [Bacteroides sp.]